jgi:hypothetical protein
MKDQSLVIDTREDVLFPEEKPTIFHLSQRRYRMSARLITRLLDSSGIVQTSSRDILRAMASFLSQRYEDMIVTCDRIICMEKEVYMVVPSDMREDLVGEITKMELYMAVRQINYREGTAFF